MSLEWNNLGTAPLPEEIEVTVMGPGHGESIVVHVGGGEWIVIDSCKEAGNRRPAPLRYLEAIGVDPSSSVRMVAATHWDQDHVKGIGEVIETCVAADFTCAKAFVRREFQDYIEVFAIGTQDRGVKDIRMAFEALRNSGRRVVGAYPGRTVYANAASTSGLAVTLQSLSPSDAEYDLFVQNLGSDMPAIRAPLRAAVPRTPNLASVVFSLKWDGCSVLLGADMEVRSEGDRGWNAVLLESERIANPKAELVKIPHHGSRTGHHDGMWQSMLVPKPIAVITPFGKGKGESRPPTVDDISRIGPLASTIFLTAPHATAKSRASSAAVTRGLRESNIQIRSLRRPMGIVRFRKTLGQVWSHQTFGPAMQVN